MYEGDVVDARPYGKGKMIYSKSKIKEGNWKDGEFTGE